MQKSFIQFALIGLITHRQIHPGLFVHNGFIMEKNIKAVFAVVRTHSAFSDTTEAHFTCCKMDNNIVDAATAIRQLRCHPADVISVA